LNRLVLVDDESGQLDILSNIIIELYPNFHVKAFDNSLKALEYIQNNDVDAVISDIRMPVMDGLKLTEEIGKVKPDVIVGIISAYSDFEYAQKAIDYGVIGYIVKPVSKAKLTELIGKIQQQTSASKENFNKINDLNNQLNEYKPIYIEKQFRQWLMGLLDSKNNELISSIFKWNGFGIVAASKLNIEPQINNNLNNLSDFIPFFKMHVKKLFSAEAAVLSVLFDEQKLIIVSIMDFPEKIPKELIVNRFEQLAKEIKNEFKLNVRIGLSEYAYHIIDNIHQCFEQAMLASDYTFLIPTPVCLEFDKVNKLKVIDESVLYSLSNKLLDRFRAFNLQGIAEQLELFCNTYANGQYIAQSNIIREHFIHMALSAKNHVQYNAFDYMLNNMNHCDTIFDLAKILSAYLEKLILYQRERDDALTFEIIQKVKSYIEAHFSEDISLEHIAEIFHFNPSYISLLFKNYSKVGFKEYLINLRIEEAKRLLRETNLKVYEIARKIGYNDVAYFVKLFKKEVGTSPNRYRSKSI